MVDVMVSTKNITRKEWLDFRKVGIGGIRRMFIKKLLSNYCQIRKKRI
jgi:hypothetical protein